MGTPDAQIVFLKAPFSQYEQFFLTKNFRQYLETILISSKILRMGIQKTPYQRTYEMQIASQDFTIDFLGSNRQFDWIEISLVYDKSDKHLTIYDSYNAECAARLIKSIELSNISEACSGTTTKKFDTSYDTEIFAVQTIRCLALQRLHNCTTYGICQQPSVSRTA